ncbi:YeiH family protein [Fusobacterium simiae]|uniref:YeiH family protein n=1 Tax=Fusobacterium simiae TaxID=855 RepID=UPI0020C2A1B7|nr:YeiH family protein [Fusobacterium simiae]MDC7956107.1 YeiH family protein [Fusobacterium simiae]
MNKLYGIVLCLLLASPAWKLGKFFPLIGGPVFGIIIGIIIAILLKNRTRFDSGINFVSKKVLQYAVILLGFGLNLQTVISVGSSSLPIIISTISISLIVAYILAKVINIPTKIATLIGVGSSICGGSAIAATAPVIDAHDDEIAQAISVIFLFNVIAALIFPSLGEMLNFSNRGFALFAGTAVNDTSSVTAAASAWDSIHNTGTLVLDSATIIKLTRTLAIIPITLFLAIYNSKKNLNTNKFSLKKIFPMFIIYFILASIITTICNYFIDTGIISKNFSITINNIFSFLKHLSKFFIIMAMVAIGLNTNIKKLIFSGTKPLTLGFCCWLAISLVSIGLQKILGIF